MLGRFLTILAEARISVLGATGRVVAELFSEREQLTNGSGLWAIVKRFVHDDHLGSLHTVTDRDGAVESTVMYGAWGEARRGDNWGLPMTEAQLDDLPTGYTGHQPELDAGLINMRGRMYDPKIGRFLSVDPVIENALEVGTWNPHSYVLNRPLSLVDPTGLAAENPEEEDGGEEISADDSAGPPDDEEGFVYWLLTEFLGLDFSDTEDIPEGEEIAESVGDGLVDHYVQSYDRTVEHLDKVKEAVKNEVAEVLELADDLYRDPVGTVKNRVADTFSQYVELGVDLVEAETIDELKNGDIGEAVGKQARVARDAYLIVGGVYLLIRGKKVRFGAKGKMPPRGTHPTGPDTMKPGPIAKESIPARGKSQRFNKTEREQINEIGDKHGCHTCGARESGRPSGELDT